MSLLTVTVVVPVSGDGPIVSVENLVGPKTVQLSGLFTGYYDLLASQNDIDFDAVAAFDAGGLAGLEQTIPGAFKSFRLRSNAIALGTVGCKVSGVDGTGQNHFAAIASLTAGFSGLTPIVDTAISIPPTGAEEDICFLCRGAFQGPVVVLGSLDGVAFNPIGAFKTDRLPEGSPTTLEFAALATTDKVRYVRLQIPGITTGNVVVTMGGRVPTGGGSAGVPIPLIITLASGQPYQGAGKASVSNAGPSSIVAGESNVIDLTSNNSVVMLGTANELKASSSESTIVGNRNTIDGSSNGPAFVGGADNTLGSNFGVIVGHNCSTTQFLTSNYLIGRNVHLIANNAGFDVLIGTDLTIRDGTYNTVIGRSITFEDGVSSCVFIGQFMTPKTGSFANLVICPGGAFIDLGMSTSNVVLGNGHTVGNNHLNNTVVGNGCTAADQVQWAVLVGIGVASSKAAHSVVGIGDGVTTTSDEFTTNYLDIVGIGSNVVVNNPNPRATNTSNLVGIGDHLNTFAASGTDVANVVNIGSLNTVTGRFSGADFGTNTVAIGNNITLGAVDGSGVGTNNQIAIGSALTTGAGCQFNLLIGNNASVGPGAVRNIVITSLGGGISVDGNRNVIVGESANVGAGVSDAVALGSGVGFSPVAIGANSSGSVAINGRIGISTDSGVAIGLGASATGISTTSIALGSHAVSLANQCVIGNVFPALSINEFAIRGQHAVPDVPGIDTLRAISQPAANGNVGLFVTVNVTGTVTSKQVLAAVTPPGGALLLYVT